MAVLIRPRGWSKQEPSTGTRINWGNSLASGLKAFFPINEGGGQLLRNLVYPPDSVPIVNGAIYKNSPIGTGLVTSQQAGGGGYLTTPSSHLLLQPPLTIWVHALITQATNGPAYLVGSPYSSIDGTPPFASTGIQVDQNDREIIWSWNVGVTSGFESLTVGSLYTDGIPFSAAQVITSTLTTAYFNSVPVASSSVSTPSIIYGGNAPFTIGHGPSPTDYGPFSCIDVVGVWNRALSQSELRQLDTDPYVLLRPPPIRILGPLSFTNVSASVTTVLLLTSTTIPTAVVNTTTGGSAVGGTGYGANTYGGTAYAGQPTLGNTVNVTTSILNARVIPNSPSVATFNIGHPTTQPLTIKATFPTIPILTAVPGAVTTPHISVPVVFFAPGITGNSASTNPHTTTISATTAFGLQIISAIEIGGIPTVFNFPPGLTVNGAEREVRVYGQWMPVGVAIRDNIEEVITMTWLTYNNGWYLNVNMLQDGTLSASLPGDPTVIMGVDNILKLWDQTSGRTIRGSSPDGFPAPVDFPPAGSDPYLGFPSDSWLGWDSRIVPTIVPGVSVNAALRSSFNAQSRFFGPLAWWKLSDAVGSTTALDSSGNNDTGTVNGTVTFGQTGPTVNVADTGVLLDGSTGYISTAIQYTNPQIFTVGIWFKTSSSGIIEVFEDTQTGAATKRDRVIYIGTDGKLYWGVFDGTTVHFCTSPTALNDGKWHLVGASIGPTNGMVLYVDGVSVATNANSVCQNFNGYWRLGGFDIGTSAGGWTNHPTSAFFAGSLAQGQILPFEMTAAQATSLFTAGGLGMTRVIASFPSPTVTTTGAPSTVTLVQSIKQRGAAPLNFDFNPAANGNLGLLYVTSSSNVILDVPSGWVRLEDESLSGTDFTDVFVRGNLQTADLGTTISGGSGNINAVYMEFTGQSVTPTATDIILNQPAPVSGTGYTTSPSASGRTVAIFYSNFNNRNLTPPDTYNQIKTAFPTISGFKTALPTWPQVAAYSSPQIASNVSNLSLDEVETGSLYAFTGTLTGSTTTITPTISGSAGTDLEILMAIQIY